jgi:GT2 family glycosyltransferase
MRDSAPPASLPGRPLLPWESSAALPSVTVVVLNYRRPADTLACLDSVDAADYPGRLDVVVVENGSGDDSARRLREAMPGRRHPTRLVEEQHNLGFAGGVNAGWAFAMGDLVCLLNNDARMHPQCLARLVAHLRGRTDLAGVGPHDAPMGWADAQRELPPDEAASVRSGTHSVIGGNVWLPLLRPPAECFTASGVCLLLVRDAVGVPFLAPYFAYFEDVYLGWRMRLEGLAFERVTTATIYHEGSLTSASQPQLKPLMAFHAEKNRLVTLLLLYRASSLCRLAPLLLVDEIKKAVIAVGLLGRGHGGAFTAYVRTNAAARWWVLRHWRWITAERARLQGRRRVTDGALFRSMSGRLSGGDGPGDRWLNRLSLAYCRLARIATVDGPQP